MTKSDIEEIKLLNKFSDLTIEQLLYAAIDASDLDEVVTLLALTPWKKYCPKEKYNGHNKYGSRIKGIIIENSKGVREIDFQEIPHEERVNMILRYL